jgi:hypothetical protein
LGRYPKQKSLSKVFIKSDKGENTMVKVSEGAFVFRGRLVVEEADKCSPDQPNRRLTEAGLEPWSAGRIDRDTAPQEIVT